MDTKGKHESLICPVCGFKRLIDTGQGCKSELKKIDYDTSEWQADYYQKCKRCKNEIGIRKVS